MVGNTLTVPPTTDLVIPERISSTAVMEMEAKNGGGDNVQPVTGVGEAGEEGQGS